MENVRNRVDVRCATNAKDYQKLVSKPTFISQKILNKNLAAVHKIKKVLALNKPTYVGLLILDLGKNLMYDFHYNYIKDRYDKNAKL